MELRQPLTIKYRPQKFEDVAGQHQVIKKLQGIVTSGRVPNGLLLSGPSGCGKTTLGRMLASYLNCDTNNVCGTCKSCKAGSNNPNIVEVNAADTRGIDDVRGLISQFRFKPTFGNFRVFILDESHALTPQAFQTLLKPLEDINQHTLVILCTTNPEKIPAAIKGRCMVLNLGTISEKDMEDRLQVVAKAEKIKILKDEKITKRIIQASNGQMRDAIQLLDDIWGASLAAKGTNLSEAIDDVFLNVEALDVQAARILLALYTKKWSAIPKTLDTTDYMGLINKMDYLNLYMIDKICGAKVWNTPLNNTFWGTLKSKYPQQLEAKNIAHYARVAVALYEIKTIITTVAGFNRSSFIGLLISKVN